jgi:hypothetical protein
MNKSGKKQGMEAMDLGVDQKNEIAPAAGQVTHGAEWQKHEPKMILAAVRTEA